MHMKLCSSSSGLVDGHTVLSLQKAVGGFYMRSLVILSFLFSGQWVLNFLSTLRRPLTPRLWFAGYGIAVSPKSVSDFQVAILAINYQTSQPDHRSLESKLCVLQHVERLLLLVLVGRSKSACQRKHCLRIDGQE